jgi:16S rRNA (cytidine1402-2'-O)-methyltransferase
VTAIPGPSAVIMAATLSGLPLHSFTFRGFPPHKPMARQKFLAADLESPYTLVYYESPYRLEAFLEDALAVFGDRQASVSNDLTKMFESTLRGSLSELVTRFMAEKIRGEYTVVIAGKPDK